jgi:hypothetical protein
MHNRAIPESMAWLDLFEDVDVETIAYILSVTTRRERQLASAAFTGENETRVARWCLWRIEHIIRERMHGK